MYQNNFLDNSMVYSVRFVIISSLPHLFISSQSTRHGLVPQDTGALSHSHQGYNELIHHLDTMGCRPFLSLEPTFITWKAEHPDTNSFQGQLQGTSEALQMRHRKEIGGADILI